jgi:glycosyltransferase involved in cell wall biosynthesis
MMRIAIVSPVWFSVPPTAYGGIEAVVHLQAEGMARAGLDVTLFASGDSLTSAELVSVFDTAPSERIGQTFWELQHALEPLRRLGEFDVVHDHTGLLGLTVFGLAGTPVVHTVHGPLEGEPGRVYRAACDAVGSAVGLVSLSRNQRRPAPELPWIANVPNAIDPDRYDAPREPGDALAFLGRMSPDKGAHHAIEVARRTGRPLRIAAKCQEPAERAYFDQVVRPHLSSEIEYLGELGHDDKVELLRTSHCLVFPIEWEEPFGLVMIEAMACGTPVVATRRGSVPEVVRDGTTGILVDAIEEMPAAVERIGALDPDTLRAEVRRRFSTERMVEGYLRAYAAAGVETAEPELLAATV